MFSKILDGNFFSYFFLGLALSGNVVAQTVHTVPDQFATIQAAVTQAVNGDLVLVKPGKYYGVIDFQGKEIVVASLFKTTGDTSFITNTILSKGPDPTLTARFGNSENYKSELCGFTISNFTVCCGGSGLIDIVNASPTLSNLRFERNGGNNLQAITISQTDEKSQVVLKGIELKKTGGASVAVSATNANLHIENSVFVQNVGGVIQNGGTLEIINCVIDGNDAGVYFSGAKIIALNSIIRSTVPENHYGIQVQTDSLAVRNSFIDSIRMTTPPAIVDMAGFKSYKGEVYYALKTFEPSRYSPFIDEGASSFEIFTKHYDAPITDMYGFGRAWKVNNIIDPGPYEYRKEERAVYSFPKVTLTATKTLFCTGENITITASPSTYAKYVWYSHPWGDIATTSQTQSSIVVNRLGNYGVRIYDDRDATVVAEIELEVIANDNTSHNVWNPGICFVTVDLESNKARVILNPTPDLYTKNWILYKESSVTGQFVALATIPYSAAGASFLDQSSNPAESSSNYSIQIQNVCDGVSDYGPSHSTLHLTGNKGLNGEVNLTWQPYSGMMDGWSMNVPSYKIYRGSAFDKLEVIAEKSATSTSFTDLTPPVGMNYYAIGITAQLPCTDGEQTIFSNLIKNDVVSSIESGDSGHTQIFPMPVSKNYRVTSSSGITSLEIFDSMGNSRSVQTYSSPQSEIECERGNLATGLYFIKISGPSSAAVKKLVLE